MFAYKYCLISQIGIKIYQYLGFAFMLSSQISIWPIQIYFYALWAGECYFCVLLFLLWLPSGFPGLLASVMTEHTFKQDFNYQVIYSRLGEKTYNPCLRLSFAPLQVNLFFSFLSEDAQVMLMASYSSDKDDDHLISIKFHFCPLSISSCRAGTGRLRWDA